MGFLINNKNQSVVTREVSGVNVGSILEFPKGTTLPASFLEANGGTFDQNVWPDLYKFLGSNKLPNGYISDARVGDVKWFQNRNAVPYGWTAADGNNVIPFSDFPDVKAAMDAGRLVTVTESVYTSDSSKRASWANATTGFRTPDYNGKSAGSLGSLFLRGDGGVAAPVGTIQGDAIRNITASCESIGGTEPKLGQMSGALQAIYSLNYFSKTTDAASPSPRSDGFTFDASRVVPTSTENRPLNTAGCWAVCLIDPNIKAIKAGGFVDNDGLLSTVGVLKRVNDVENRLTSIESLPTVLESGRLSNGHRFRKWSDGTLECWVTVTTGTSGVSTQLPIPTVPWPSEFTTVDYAVFSVVMQLGQGAQDLTGKIMSNGVYQEHTATDCIISSYCYTYAIHQPVVIAVHAVGSWK